MITFGYRSGISILPCYVTFIDYVINLKVSFHLTIEKEVLDLIQNIKFRSVKESFQKKLKEDILKKTVIQRFCLRRQNR